MQQAVLLRDSTALRWPRRPRVAASPPVRNRGEETRQVTGPDQEALMRKVAVDGDRAAFAVLFNHFAPRLKSFLMRQGAEAAVAEELVQESMLTLWRRAASFDPRQASLATWLFTVARNKRIDRLRRDRKPALEADEPALVAPAEPADRRIEGEQRAARLRRALKALPPEQAALVQMAYFEERAQSEIAAAAALPLGTVKSRLRLALARLRKELKEETR